MEIAGSAIRGMTYFFLGKKVSEKKKEVEEVVEYVPKSRI